MLSKNKKGIAEPLIVILGPTAVGKTALAIELAKRFAGEIISADSRQVYRNMHIGVAKPDEHELLRVPHHLLDVVNPDETLSAAEFQRLAYTAIDDILTRGKTPFLVGGTGQYISVVIEGWQIPDVPPNEALRAELEAYAAEHGPQTLHNRLQTLDPVAAQNIHPNNVRRVIRALEVCIETDQPISELQRKQPPPYRILQIGLTLPRAVLYDRIDTRIDKMMAQGLLNEVQTLLEAGYARSLPAMSGLGYAQLCDYLCGEKTLEEAVNTIRTDTHDFARRQETWFKKYNKSAHWFQMTENHLPTIIELIKQWLENADATN